MSISFDGITLGGISVLPLTDGFEEGCTAQGPYAVVPYLMAWNDRWKFLQFLAGTTSTTGPDGPWIRPTPYRYPVDLGGASIYANDAKMKGVGNIVSGPGEVVEWEGCIVTATFGPMNYTVNFQLDDPLFLNSLSQDPDENQSLQYATQELDFGSEWINIPNSSAGFSDGVKIDTPMSRRLTVVKMDITWHRYPLMPMDKIATYADSVNDAKFLGRERGTVMLNGVKTVREQASDGTITQKVRMSLKWRKHDWNEFLRPDDNTFDAVIYGGDSSSSTYPYKDFKDLLL